MEFIFADRVEDVLIATIPKLSERLALLHRRPLDTAA
jgi:hypothetical protein